MVFEGALSQMILVTVVVYDNLPGIANITLRIAEKGIEVTIPVNVNMPDDIPVIQFLPGDINGDGEVDIRDLVRLARYIAEIDKSPLGKSSP